MDRTLPCRPGDEMGAKLSLVEVLGPSPTLENIEAAYENGEEEAARELIQQACCVECSAGTPHISGVRLLYVASQHGDLQSVTYLLKEAGVAVPQEPSSGNPAIVAAYYGHTSLVQELLDSMPGPCVSRDLLNWMLATSCQQGHIDVVRLLVQAYNADTKDYVSPSDEFAAITGLPLYAAAQAGNQEIACFLLQNGAGFSSYTLMDHPAFSKHLLRLHLREDINTGGDQEVVVCWSGLQLPWLELDWFMDFSSRIVHLDLSSNCLVALPSVVPWGLVELQVLDLSNNLLKELPAALNSQEVICSSLRQVSLSQNQLTTLPPGLLHLTNIQRLSACKNRLLKLFDIPAETNWIGLRRLEELDVSDNCLTVLPTNIMHRLKSLKDLNVCRNKLTVFPDPWACPLKQCKASSNEIESLPNAISVLWRTHLQEVDFSDNHLKELPSYIFELEAVVWLRLSGNLLVTLPPPSTWRCSKLRTLDISRNHLGKTEEIPRTWKLAFLTTWTRREPDPDPVCLIEFPMILQDSLEVLFLNDNRLECVPPSVCGLHSLTELYLSSNPGIRELPAELGQLSNLWQLDIEGLNISNVPQEVRTEGPPSVLKFLRAQLRKAEPCRLLKMIVIGPSRQGKSAVLEALQTGRVSPFGPTHSSISTSTWQLDNPNPGKSNKDSVVFNVWDVGGQTSMSTVNQCFFTDKALYVVVWNLALGEEAVAHLQTWLLNIEARAPNAAVVVVGTHLDLIESRFRTERLATLRAYVLALCRSPSGTRASGFPDITWKHLHEVSCKTLEGLDGLKTLIYQVVQSMKDNGSSSTSTGSGGRLLGRLIPRSYLTLQEAVITEKHLRQREGEVQYLTEAQLDQIIQQNPDSDIRDYDDLQTAVGFLIDTGTLLHFADTSHGLCMLYFLCPVWLSECLERIIHLKSSSSVARNGVIRTEDLRMLMVGTGFSQHTEEQYFQFLAKFEIALPLSNNSYLLPHLLPPKPAMDLHLLRLHTHNTLQRLFQMSFVPAGFWERFIARMLISLADMDAQLFEPKRNERRTRSRNSVMYSFTGSRQRNRCSTFRVRRSSTVYWREGLLVTYTGGYLSVESSDVNWKRKKSGGIKIMCQSEMRDFSAMAFITDHVHSLIEQWFPALTASESDGSLLMEQYAPCPLCSSANQQNHMIPPGCHLDQTAGRGGEGGAAEVHYFNMEDCVLAAMEKQFIICPLHPEKAVPLQELVPELFMTDFPARLFLEKSLLEYSEEEENILGQGGSGTIIYRAQYCSQPVAVKCFHFKKCRQQTISSDTDTMVKHLRSADARRSFSEFRQEAGMLRSLQHPCIVSLVGISIHPLCFALHLAPLSSLNTVLAEKHKGSGYIPLGHMLTFKVSYQIAAGLAYLHRKSIIFCDLKSDNILVWSLEEQDVVNIKLSDYGISRQSFHEGALGVEGTPGYQAPEVRPGIVYDEKVDMFSYGMVLYELLTGQRPVLGNHQLQISKKLSKGIRPMLARPAEVQFYCLQNLLTECWDTKPEKRPMAVQCLRQMQEPSFPCLRYLLPCGRHSQLFLSQLQGHSAVLWDGHKETRNYSVVNVDTGMVEVQRMSCPGARISCQIKLGNSLWIATEEQELFIYSLKDMCPLSQPQRHFPCPGVITCLFPVQAKDQSLDRVFAGMFDGLVAVYSLADGLPLEGEAYLCPHTLNKTLFGVEDSDSRQKPYPVRTMALVSSGEQLWFSNGPGVLVIDCVSLQAVGRLEPYSHPSSIVSMASSFSLWGDEVVWTLDDLTNTLLLYHATSYQLCASYCCGDSHPLRDVFTIRPPTDISSDTTSDLQPSDRLKKSEWTNGHVTLIHSEKAGTQIIQHQDSVTHCSTSSSIRRQQRHSDSSSAASTSLSSSSNLSVDRMATGMDRHRSNDSEGVQTSAADTRSQQDSSDSEGLQTSAADTGPQQESNDFEGIQISAANARPQQDSNDSEGVRTSAADAGPQQDSNDSEGVRTSAADAGPQQDSNDSEGVQISATPSPPQLQAFTVLPVNGTLWIPRRGGDMMVIEMQSQSNQLRGRVIAVLRPPGCPPLGILKEAALVAKDTIVCGFHSESSGWSLCVWRAWGSNHLEVFYQSNEELARMEADVRKRR